MPKQVHQPGETDSDQSFPKISTGSRFQLSPPSARLAIVVGEPSKTGHVIRVKRPAIAIEPLSVVPSERNVDARRARAGLGIVSTATVAMPTLIANLALEITPIRVNLIAAGFVDTPLSASILGGRLPRQCGRRRAGHRRCRGEDCVPHDVAVGRILLCRWYDVRRAEGLAGNGQQSSPSRSGVGLTLIVQTRLTAATLEAGTNGAGRKRYERRWQMAPKYRSKTGLHL